MNEPLFNSAASVCMKCSGHDDRFASVRIQLELQTSSSPLQRKELNVRLTDDADPFFLFSLSLGEEDFQSLKVQQGLLVDYTAFPQKLIELLQRCAEEQNGDTPRFVLQLHCSEPSGHGLAELCIVETNPFKHLTHLALRLQPGSDADVKKYLAACLTRLQGEHSTLNLRLKTTESTLSGHLQETKKALSVRTRELESLQSEWNAHTESLVAKHRQELAETKQRALQTQRDLELRYEREKKGMDEQMVKGSSEMHGRVADLQTANKELTDKKYRLDSIVRELKGKLSTIEEDYQRAQHDLQCLRQQRGSLESDQRSREQTLAQQQTRIAVLQQEVRDKEALLAKSNQLMEAANDQKAKLEESMQHKNSLVAKLQSTVKSSSQEVMKGNKIIQKLQEDLRATMAKLKLKNAVTGKQEKLLGEKSQTLRALQQDNDALKTKSQQLENETERLKDSLETTRAKLEESRQLLKTNENVINWLNKQVNEAQMTKRQKVFEVPSSAVPYKPQGEPVAITSQPPWPRSGSHLTHTMSTIPQSTPMGPLNSTPMSVPSLSKHSEPALDPKYLQRQSQPVAKTTGGPGNQPRAGHVPLQLSSTPTGGATPPGLTPPSLMSAYFATQLQGAS